jgi:nitroreductase
VELLLRSCVRDQLSFREKDPSLNDVRRVMSSEHESFVPYNNYREFGPAEMLARARNFGEEIRRRRSVRSFSSRPIPDGVLQQALLAAGSAPSGANFQPWHFAVIQSREVKAQIREAAEEEERAFYSGRAPDEWRAALAPLGTDAHKPFLETAPALIAIFGQSYAINETGERRKNYYVSESVGIATGFLIAALTRAGLATLTHTPSPMAFLNAILGRPANERPFLLLVVGFPADGVQIPRLTRKTLPDIASFH